MRRALSLLILAANLIVVSPAFTLEKIVTIEGLVEVITSPAASGTVAYWTEDAQHVRYKVILTDPERGRLTSIIERDPTTVLRFDGTIVDEDGEQTIRVHNWNAVTTTTTSVDSQGNRTVEKTTTYTK